MKKETQKKITINKKEKISEEKKYIKRVSIL